MNTAKKLVTPTLYTIAKESMESANCDETRALRLMMDRVRHEKGLFESILTTACREWIREIRAAHNSAKWNGTARYVTSIDKTSRGARLEAYAEWALMDTRLPNGKRLGDAMKQDIEDAAETYRKKATTEAHKARWYDLIARKIGSQPVAKVLTEKQLQQLQKDAEDE